MCWVLGNGKRTTGHHEFPAPHGEWGGANNAPGNNNRVTQQTTDDEYSWVGEPAGGQGGPYGGLFPLKGGWQSQIRAKRGLEGSDMGAGPEGTAAKGTGGALLGATPTRAQPWDNIQGCKQRAHWGMMTTGPCKATRRLL